MLEMLFFHLDYFIFSSYAINSYNGIDFVGLGGY